MNIPVGGGGRRESPMTGPFFMREHEDRQLHESVLLLGTQGLLHACFNEIKTLTAFNR